MKYRIVLFSRVRAVRTLLVRGREQRPLALQAGLRVCVQLQQPKQETQLQLLRHCLRSQLLWCLRGAKGQK